MLQTHSETMAERTGGADSVVVIEQAGIVIDGLDSGCLLDHVPDIAAMHVVSSKFHITVVQVEGSVETAHPRCGDAVSTAPAAHSHTHSAASAHALHHTAGHIVESTVVGIVSVENDAYLAVIGKSADHSGTLIAEVIHIGTSSGDIMSASGHKVSEPSVHHARLHRKVYHSLFLTVINAGEQCLVGFLLHNLDLVDKLCRDVLRCELRVVKEESLAVDGDLGNRLAIGCNRSVCLNLDSWKLLEKLLEHVIVGCLE